MKKHESKKNSRRWVIRAMVTFLVVLALLTFFSNTIMNATIPLVVTSTATRGNLAFTNSATGQVVSDSEIKVKGLEGRTVSEVLHTNYDQVQAGDVIVTLLPVEDMSDLETLESDLRTAQRNLEYARRAPSHANTFITETQAVRTAERNLAQAQADINSAATRDEAIAAARATLSANQAAAAALTTQVAAATASVEAIQLQIEACYARLAVIDGTAVVTPVPGMYCKLDPDPSDTTPEPTGEPLEEVVADPTPEPTGDPTPAPTADPTPTTEPTVAPTTEPTVTPTVTPVPAVPTSAIPTNNSNDRTAILNQIAQLQQQLVEAQNRLAGYSAQLTAANEAVTAATTAITTAEALPSSYAAQDALVDAQAALDAANLALSDARINAGINADKAQDSIEDYERQIETLTAKVNKKRAELEQTEIVAPADGYLYNVGVSEGDKLTAEGLVFSIVPQDSTYSVSFTFPTTVVQNMQPGQEFSSSNYYWINKIVITSIKPDPQNPRESRIVKCSVSSDYGLMPGESITVTADRSNATYDHVVAASAVSEDNSGKFVYVVIRSSGPLGDRYVVRRVTVNVEETSGAFVAISGEGLDNAMVVTRSEQPLHNGDRVRLEDYSGDSN
ncbi:MAG: HlyD family efflux transporter periplasmic adaptor subunit [Clostridiales bacterium]|nr:HlyD family efflux transporter periplasmic adaptor subunit [Clostridiales bacterium]